MIFFVSGKPPPRLTWWREHALLDDSFEVVNGRTTNTFVMTNIRCDNIALSYSYKASVIVNTDSRFAVKAIF